VADSPYEEVVSPLGRAQVGSVALSPNRVADLNGKTVAELQNMEFVNYFPPLREALKRRYPDVRIIEASEFGLTHGPNEPEVIANLPAKLEECEVDLAISAFGV
jgi:hypothetical protein